MSNPTFFSVLVVEGYGGELSGMCREKGCATTCRSSASEALEVLENQSLNLLILVLSEESKLEKLMGTAVDKQMDVLVVGPNDEKLERHSLALGAREYFTRETALEQLGPLLEAGSFRLPEGGGGAAIKKKISDLLLGNSSPMQGVFKQIARVAPTSAPVLITGESGTGKEKAAEAIHRLSRRHNYPFLPANCGAISPQLIQSELFGHEKGSFTGAVRDHAGYFERANGGTLFLDEITEMPIELQVNLLRVLETGTFARVGSSRQQKTDIRIIAATNRDPHEAVDQGHLREDLLYRIQVFPLDMPPLRERQGDVELLAQHFLWQHNQQEKTSRRFSSAALEALRRYSWPGNLRELKNVVYCSFIMADEVIEVSDLPAEVTAPRVGNGTQDGIVQVGATLAEMEEKLILSTLVQCNGRRERAARMLGISTKTLYNRLREYRGREGRDGREGFQAISDAR